MGKSSRAGKDLRKFFKKIMVADIGELLDFMETKSRMTVFRYLQRVGYLSSYSHAGRYYTLLEIPTFNEYGLWHYSEISFSRAGTLKATIYRLVDNAETGFTHRELRNLLRIRVQNALNDLIFSGQIGRQSVEDLFVYVSGNTDKASLQLDRRQEHIQGKHKDISLPPMLIIEVLLELLRTKFEWEPQMVAKSLRARGISVSIAEVASVLEQYNLKKTSKWSK